MLDITAIRAKVLDANDLIIFDEALGCYNNKLYRSAYIMAWISIIESLKRKIFFLSNEGDTRATTVHQGINTKEENGESTDTYIFRESKVIGIIRAVDFPAIEFFYKNRCLYAHPYSVEPTEQDVVYIFNKAVEIVLSIENYLGKDYINHVITNYLENRHYLEDSSVKIDEYVKEVLNKIKPEAHKYFLKTLFFALSTKYNEKDKVWLLLRYRRFLLKILQSNHEELHNEAEWRLKENATKFTEAFIYAYVSSETWMLLSEDIRNIIFRFIEQGNILNKYRICRVIYWSKTAPLLNKNEQHIYAQLIEKLHPFNAFEFYDDEKKIERILSMLYAKGFEVQNQGITIFTDIINDKSINEIKTKPENLFEIGRALCFCLTWNNFTAQNIHSVLINNYNETILLVIKGFIYNVFIIDPVRVRTYGFSNYKLLEKTCELLNLLNENDIEDIKKKIIESLNKMSFVVLEDKFIAEFNKLNEKETKPFVIQFFNDIKEVYLQNIEEE